MDYEDLFISLDDRPWKSCTEEQKLSANASSFSFVTNAEGEAIDVARIRTPMHLLSHLTECQETKTAWNCQELDGISDSEVVNDLKQCYRVVNNAKAPRTKKKQNRKEASSTELRQYKNQFGAGQ